MDSRITVDKSESFTLWLFFRKDSRSAADALLCRLREKDGWLTEKEMSQLAKELETGGLGFRFSKNNFYRRVLRTFLSLGFIGKGPRYDAARRKTVNVYRAIVQPIPSHKPTNPSFWSVAYDVCEWWNDMMFSDDKHSPVLSRTTHREAQADFVENPQPKSSRTLSRK